MATKYLGVLQHYAGLIDNGKLLPGDQLPTLPELTELHGISHLTATKVVRMLRDDDYVYTTTKGTFVYLTKQKRLFKKLCDALNELESDGQQLQLEDGESGWCVIGRDGGVCWDAEAAQWEQVAT